MEPDIASFFSQPKLQAITLSICLGFLFFIVPLLQRKVRATLTQRQKELIDPIANDILIQVFILFVCVILYSLIAFFRADASFVSGDALPFICLVGSLSSLWNIRRATVAVKHAQRGSNKPRLNRLTEVSAKNLMAYTAALISGTYGAVVVFLVLLVPQVLPNWLWFVNFLMTGPTIYALGWSISILAVATEYSNDTKLGRSNLSLRQKRSKVTREIS